MGLSGLERFLRTIERADVDRPACWLGMPDPSALPGLYAHFGVSDIRRLKQAVGDDIYPVEMPYQSPTSSHIYAAFDFTLPGRDALQERTLTAPGWFADAADMSALDGFPWPDPERYIDTRACAAAVSDVPQGRAVLGVLWSAHFQDACAAFGMETALIRMLEAPELYQAVDERIVDFYLRANKVFYESTKGRLHAVLIGNDLGSQSGLMLSRALIRRLVLPGAKRLIDQAHSYGVKVIYHSCGSVSEIFDDLLEAGVDALHPIQALAAGMDAEGLARRFGGKASFCGGVDTQELLVRGTEAMVEDRVSALRALFPTGLIVSPSHEALLADVRPQNVGALFRAATRVG